MQIEPWLTRDKAMIDLLKSIGIEKGKPFNPDAKTQEILNAAAREAQAWLDADTRPASRRSTKAATGRSRRRRNCRRRWRRSMTKPDAYPVDARGLADSLAFISAQASGRGPVLPDGGEGQGRPGARWAARL